MRDFFKVAMNAHALLVFLSSLNGMPVENLDFIWSRVGLRPLCAIDSLADIFSCESWCPVSAKTRSDVVLGDPVQVTRYDKDDRDNRDDDEPLNHKTLIF